MKRYFPFPGALEQKVIIIRGFIVISRTLVRRRGFLTPLPRCSRRILQPQPAGLDPLGFQPFVDFLFFRGQVLACEFTTSLHSHSKVVCSVLYGSPFLPSHVYILIWFLANLLHLFIIKCFLFFLHIGDICYSTVLSILVLI